MNDDFSEVRASFEPNDGPDEQIDTISQDVAKLHSDYQSRLVLANLRTEAVQAGMVDLDGLKLVDLSSIRLGNDDRVVGARKLMDDLRRNKPWLFGAASSSSAAIAPASQPVRKKTALEMSDEEYASARAAVTKYQF